MNKPWCECKAVGSDRCVMEQNYEYCKDMLETLDETLNGEHGLMTNHMPHLQKDIGDIKKDLGWLKWLVGGMLLAMFSAAIGLIASG